MGWGGGGIGVGVGGEDVGLSLLFYPSSTGTARSCDEKREGGGEEEEEVKRVWRGRRNWGVMCMHRVRSQAAK